MLMKEKTSTGFQSNNNKRYLRIVRKKNLDVCRQSYRKLYAIKGKMNFKKSEHFKF